MITRFSEAVLTRQSGKRETIEYKKERLANEDNINTILRRFRITQPEWNKLTQQFEFIDYYWQGKEEDKPIGLELYDEQGFLIDEIVQE